jgi:hypothetical protein
MNFAVSAAPRAKRRVKIISIVVLPFASVNVTVTRKSGGVSSVRAVVVDELLVRLDHVVRRDVRVIDAVRAVHRVAPLATHAQVLAVRGEREAARPPPLRHLLGKGPRVPHRAHRRVVHPGEPDLVRFYFSPCRPSLFAVLAARCARVRGAEPPVIPPARLVALLLASAALGASPLPRGTPCARFTGEPGAEPPVVPPARLVASLLASAALGASPLPRGTPCARFTGVAEPPVVPPARLVASLLASAALGASPLPRGTPCARFTGLPGAEPPVVPPARLVALLLASAALAASSLYATRFRCSPRRSSFSSHITRYASRKAAAGSSAPGSSRQGRCWPSRLRVMSPARSSTLRCLVIAGPDSAKGSARSFTGASPRDRR